jgi:hypothetical protein
MKNDCLKFIIGNKEIELSLCERYIVYKIYRTEFLDNYFISIIACKQSNATELTVQLHDCYHSFYIRKFASKDIINNELHVDPKDIIDKFFIFIENKMYSNISLSFMARRPLLLSKG